MTERTFEVTDKGCPNKTGQLFRLGCCQEKQRVVDLAIIHLVENRVEQMVILVEAMLVAGLS